HQRIDRAFTHADQLREAAGDVVGIAVAARQHGEHAHIQDALPQLHLQSVGHQPIAPVFSITWYLAKQGSALYGPCPEAKRGHHMQPDASRYHALDALRAAMMFLGIYLHAAAAYSPHGDWHVKPPQVTTALDYTIAWIHVFRMPVFYVMAGFFAALLLARY